MEELIITCPSFEDHGLIPKKHTGFGEDASPGFHIGNLSPEAVSIAILMEAGRRADDARTYNPAGRYHGKL